MSNRLFSSEVRRTIVGYFSELYSSFLVPRTRLMEKPSELVPTKLSNPLLFFLDRSLSHEEWLECLSSKPPAVESTYAEYVNNTKSQPGGLA